MGNKRIEAIIAEKLRTGFLHPGDPAKDIPPTPILLPFKAPAGAPKEMTNLMDGTVKLLAECIVSAIEVDGKSEIVERAEARAMRRAVGEGPTGPTIVPVFCRCDPQRKSPLAMLTVNDPEAPIVLDGAALLRGLHQRSAECPHEVIAP